MASYFPHSKWSQRKQGRSFSVFCHWVSRVMLYHFSPPVLFRVDGDSTKLMKSRNARVLGSHLGGWRWQDLFSLCLDSPGSQEVVTAALSHKQWNEFKVGQMGEGKVTLKKYKDTWSKLPWITGPVIQRIWKVLCFKQLGKREADRFGKLYEGLQKRSWW